MIAGHTSAERSCVDGKEQKLPGAASFCKKPDGSFVRILLIENRPEPNMTELQATKTGLSSSAKTAVGRLFVLELSGDRIHSMNLDGSDRKTIVTDCHLPDGIVVDAKAGHIYWTNMPRHHTHTPKQIHLDKDSSKLYWCDREGMRVMRANLDGSHVETLVETGRGDEDRRDQTRWCVGITIDPKLGKIYWTQKGPTKGGLCHLCRANIDIATGESPANRTNIEVLFDQLPEPIDLELDLANRVLYWTDAAILRAATPSIAHRSTKRRCRRF
jgi:hypothetical protein